MVSENIFVNSSGTLFGEGSVTLGQYLLYGISGGTAIPVSVNGAGAIVTV